ncbi:MAG TPA: lipocalin-like domain-containing protein [Candidatus Xenobia bacterium]|jgi:predicted secreted hydrolase
MRLLLILALLAFTADGYRIALPGYHYRFPFDQGSHDDYQSEWWYYTGHLFSGSHEWGYELTFFRIALQPPSAQKQTSRWSASQIYLAHLALTDVNGHIFNHWEKLNRPGIDTAGADTGHLHVYNDGWTATDTPSGDMKLHADFLDLTLHSAAPAVVHGHDGISVKGPGTSNASHYYSYTHLQTTGSLSGEPVTGTSWMDHEFGSSQLSPHQAGWDWFALQLDRGTDIMLYQMRDDHGHSDRYSSGTLVQGNQITPLHAADVHIEPRGHWKSPHTGGNYPMGWTVTIPSHHMTFNVTPLLDDQELVSRTGAGPTYWEGTAKVDGSLGAGRAYVEMTGYAGKVSL